MSIVSHKGGTPLVWPTDFVDKIICGDCLQVMKYIPDGAVDCVVTDPPYSSGTRQATNRSASNIPKRGERWSRAGIVWDTSFSTFGLSILMNVFMAQSKRVMGDGSHIYTFIDWRQYPLMTLSVEHAGLFINNCLVWNKGVYALGGNYRSQHEMIVFASRGVARELNGHDVGNVLMCKRVSGGSHPTEKPVELINTLIRYATNPDDIILDPFCGSGTTCVAAKQLGRKYIGIEINPDYCKIAEDRLRQGELFGGTV